VTTNISEVLPPLTNSGPKLGATVFPNPFNAKFYLDVNAKAHSTATVQVINEIGAIVYRQQLTALDNGPLEINLVDQALKCFVLLLVKI